MWTKNASVVGNMSGGRSECAQKLHVQVLYHFEFGSRINGGGACSMVRACKALHY